MRLRRSVAFSLGLWLVNAVVPMVPMFAPPANAQATTQGGNTDVPQTKPVKKPAPPPQERATPQGQTPPAPAPAAAAPTPAVAQSPEAPAQSPGELQPILHALSAKVTTCMDQIVGQAASVIDAPHTAISSWVPSAPNDNIFSSIVGLQYASKIVPNAAAIILASPIGPGRCHGQTVQIYPTAQPCGIIQANLLKDGTTVAALNALPVVEMKNGTRNVLMPGVGGSCVVVAVKLY